MISKSSRKTCAVMLSLALVIGMVGAAPRAEAEAKKPALAKKSITVKVKKTKAVKVKNVTKKNAKAMTLKVNTTKIIKAKKVFTRKMATVKVTGKKKGKAKVTVTVKLKKRLEKKIKYVLTLNVTVTNAITPTAEPTPVNPVPPVTGPPIDVEFGVPELADQKYIPRSGGGYVEKTTVSGTAVTMETTKETGSALDATVKRVNPEDALGHGSVAYQWYEAKSKDVKTDSFSSEEAWEVDAKTPTYSPTIPESGAKYYFCKVSFNPVAPHPEQPYASVVTFTNIVEVKTEKLKVTYKGAGATFKETDSGTTGKSEKVVEYLYGDPIGDPPTKDDLSYSSSWTFLGWGKATGGSVDKIDPKTPVEEDLTYYAHWDIPSDPAPAPTTVTITFSLGNLALEGVKWSDETNGDVSISVTAGGQISVPVAQRTMKALIGTGYNVLNVGSWSNVADPSVTYTMNNEGILVDTEGRPVLASSALTLVSRPGDAG